VARVAQALERAAAAERQLAPEALEDLPAAAAVLHRVSAAQGDLAAAAAAPQPLLAPLFSAAAREMPR
jgi:hypothetical protein